MRCNYYYHYIDSVVILFLQLFHYCCTVTISGSRRPTRWAFRLADTQHRPTKLALLSRMLNDWAEKKYNDPNLSWLCSNSKTSQGVKRRLTWNLLMTSSGTRIKFLKSIKPRTPMRGKATEAANQVRVMGGMLLNQSPTSDIFVYSCWHTRFPL